MNEISKADNNKYRSNNDGKQEKEVVLIPFTCMFTILSLSCLCSPYSQIMLTNIQVIVHVPELLHDRFHVVFCKNKFPESYCE